MKFYLLTWSSKKTKAPVAFVEGESRPSFKIAKDIFNEDRLPFSFKIQYVKETNTGLLKTDNFSLSEEELWLDYLPNQFAWPLFSEKAKDIIKNSLSKTETIHWICADVIFNNIIKTYYILQFEKELDTLNFDKTMFVSGTDAIIKPVFSENKLYDLNIFHTPAINDLWKITSSIYISERLKNNLIKEKCTNMEFSLAKIE